MSKCRHSDDVLETVTPTGIDRSHSTDRSKRGLKREHSFNVSDSASSAIVVRDRRHPNTKVYKCGHSESTKASKRGHSTNESDTVIVRSQSKEISKRGHMLDELAGVTATLRKTPTCTYCKHSGHRNSFYSSKFTCPRVLQRIKVNCWILKLTDDYVN